MTEKEMMKQQMCIRDSLMAVWAKRRSFKNQLRGTTLVAGKHPAASCHQPAKQANSLT